MSAIWIVERTGNRRFPFRVSIVQNGRLLVAVRAQSAWPGPGQQVFCLRERELDPAESLEPMERVPVAHLSRVGRKLTIVLDRPLRKRCELLAVRKPYRDSARGMHEQIFFRTESGIRAHRSRTRAEIRPDGVAIAVAVDSAEKYPWRFPGATTERRKLRVGDYGLLHDGRVVAVVERKTYDNMLADLGAVQALHHSLADLASLGSAALVVEAQYGDFLDPRRLRGRWPAAFVGKVLAEIAAMHPTLPIVFAGNRKLANQWTHQFFAAHATSAQDEQLSLVREVGARYEVEPRTEGLDGDIAAAALSETAPFQLRAFASRFPDVPEARVRRVLNQLRQQGRITCSGRGRAAHWSRAGP
ncbi:MAG: ERCC4 domain-containing protein [Gemmatimonadota bacterium]